MKFGDKLILFLKLVTSKVKLLWINKFFDMMMERNQCTSTSTTFCSVGNKKGKPKCGILKIILNFIRSSVIFRQTLSCQNCSRCVCVFENQLTKWKDFQCLKIKINMKTIPEHSKKLNKKHSICCDLCDFYLIHCFENGWYTLLLRLEFSKHYLLHCWSTWNEYYKNF